ncbi:MAG: CDP-diacylglycerol--serine O-phosphatidyltransferase [Bacteroidales bacterium]|nr:CDP-diacylglycerol--serine O-phosphatidyltransferase [Bacteroidales bacterium]
MKKHIPDCVTLMNLLCGTLACILAMMGQYVPAWLFILAAACFDFLDGLAARLLKAISPMGKELDSLCDLVSFGLAPTLMFFHWYLHAGHSYSAFAYCSLLIVLFAALRLARFNTDPGQGTDFRGLPVPAAAMIAASATAYASVSVRTQTDTLVSTLLNTGWFIPVLSAVLAFLMISNIPMFSMKHKRLSFKEFPKESIFFVLSVVILFVLTLMRSLGRPALSMAGWMLTVLPLGLLLAFTIYVLMNLVAPRGNQNSIR